MAHTWLFGNIYRGAIRRSQSAPRMHVLVCICNNVRQFHNVWPGPLNCYATHLPGGGGRISRSVGFVWETSHFIGRKISHAKSRGFCEISRTSGRYCGLRGEGLFVACALHVYKPHLVLSIGAPPSLGGPNPHKTWDASLINPLSLLLTPSPPPVQELLCRELRLLLPEV